MPEFTACGQIVSPPLQSADWKTFKGLNIPHVNINFDHNTDTVRVVNNSSDNLLLTPEALVGTVIVYPQFNQQYVLQKQEVDQFKSIAISLLDFHSASELARKLGCYQEFLSLQKGQYVTVDIDDMFEQYDLVRLK